MKVASVQVEIRDDESKEERISRVEKMLDSLTDHDLIILPEIWATGFFSFDRYQAEAEPLNGAFRERFAAKAKQLNAYFLAGSMVEQEGEHFYNTSLLFDPNGHLVGTYRKIHLFRYQSEEGKILSPGKDLGVFQTELGTVALSTCFDLRFPELYRKQIDQGATLFLVTSAWPLARLEHWNLLNRVRPLENQTFLVSSNCVGLTRGFQLAGHSVVVNPRGVPIASGDETEMLIQTEFDLAQVKEIRESFPQLTCRML
ncbi:Predicted amidohydrolase [Seinonella peptonophila]|uniref:Predicted amidohydrolase n=1 Tax=Seinonella peptonophila TaxID=112248 RepID=A0A1M4VJR7_9BACL|nr:carbon-nitrogen family hydrolase [Seinonella peptonophila]SHE69125.1 Predicted amidohydrolase [Seinonella peptonophila]